MQLNKSSPFLGQTDSDLKLFTKRIMSAEPSGNIGKAIADRNVNSA